MASTSSTIGLLAALVLGAAAQEPAPANAPFPASTAIAEGVSPEALQELDELVQGLVDDEEIIGAELHVIKNGRTVLHEAYGWQDREAQVPMETGSVFCVRSMTKPVIGTAILMLVQDGLLAFDDRVAQYLPSFDVEGSREITVEELLTHTSGLPMSLLLGKDLRELDGIRAVADLGAGQLLFEPGSDLNYSDQGTDTLTALIEVVTAAPAADFVQARVLDPLGMADSACVLSEDHPLRARALPKYVGSRGEWTAFWRPDEPELFPFFLGSQGLYSTTTDYARFMEFWRARGRTPAERLLKPRLVRKALRPGPFPMDAPTGLPGLRGDYGFLMQLWTGPEEGGDEDDREVVAFGHNGSDGTHAWVFPEQKGIVLYFTQSRNNITGLRMEEVLGELFLGVPFDPNQEAPPFEDYLGYYWEGENDLYRAIVRDGEDLALEIMGKGVVPLTYAGDDRWKMPDPSKVLAFQRDDTGRVTGYRIGDHQEYRFEPSAELPGVDELQARARNAHRLDLLETLGPVRMTSTLNIPKLEITGEISALYSWPERFRIDTVAREEFESLAFDGTDLRYLTSRRSLATLDGERGELLRLGNNLARFGDWSRWHSGLTVIQRLEKTADWSEEPEVVYLVRTGDTSAPARTLYVHWETGRVFREDGLTHMDTLGRIGQRLNFGDFRDVSGMLLPHRTEIEVPHPLIGNIELAVTEVELGVELSDGVFELSD